MGQAVHREQTVGAGRPDVFRRGPAKLDNAPPPEAPAVTVRRSSPTQPRSSSSRSRLADQQTQASEERIAEAANTLEGGHVQNDAARVAAEQERTRVDATVKLHQIQAERDTAILQYANAHKISIDEAKVQLAKTAMQLQTERDLNARQCRKRSQAPARGSAAGATKAAGAGARPGSERASLRAIRKPPMTRMLCTLVIALALQAPVVARAATQTVPGQVTPLRQSGFAPARGGSLASTAGL